MVPACYGMLTLVFLSSIIIVVDEDEDGGLRGLADVLLSYGERHLEGPPNRQDSRRGVWAGVLLMCGQFERVMYFKRVEVTFPDTLQAVSALWAHQESEVEAVHLAVALAYHGLLRVPSRVETSDMTPRMFVSGSYGRYWIRSIVTLPSASPPALRLSTLIWRYIRPFVNMDAKEALQYVYCMCLSADQGEGVGQEQVEIAWELARRIIVLSNGGPAWEELEVLDLMVLCKSFIEDSNSSNCVEKGGIFEQGASLLHPEDSKQFNEQILISAARDSEENDRIYITSSRLTTDVAGITSIGAQIGMYHAGSL